MTKTETKIKYVLIFALIAWLAIELGLTTARFAIGKNLNGRARSFTYNTPETTARALVIGDSSAVGVGSSTPTKSVAGLFAVDYPNFEVVNLAQGGAETDDVLEQLQAVTDQVTGKRFDLIIIHTGALDIIQFTNIDQLKGELEELLGLARSMSDDVVLITSGNIGLAPIFPSFVKPFMSQRTRVVREDFIRIAASNDVTYIDLFEEKHENSFAGRESEFFAPDGFHLSDRGYQVWYDKLLEGLNQEGVQLVK